MKYQISKMIGRLRYYDDSVIQIWRDDKYS